MPCPHQPEAQRQSPQCPPRVWTNAVPERGCVRCVCVCTHTRTPSAPESLLLGKLGSEFIPTLKNFPSKSSKALLESLKPLELSALRLQQVLTARTGAPSSGLGGRRTATDLADLKETTGLLRSCGWLRHQPRGEGSGPQRRRLSTDQGSCRTGCPQEWPEAGGQGPLRIQSNAELLETRHCLSSCLHLPHPRCGAPTCEGPGPAPPYHSQHTG